MKIRLQYTIDIDMKFLSDYFTKMPTASLKESCFVKTRVSVRKLHDNNPAMEKE